MKKLKDRIKHEEDYVEFLTKRIISKNFRLAASEEELRETEAKLKKVKLVLRILKNE